MLVFSSAETTNSSSRRQRPCQVRAYKSRMRPALAGNCGSRGKIQHRCCQGRMACSCSQRHTVLVADAGHQPRAFGLPRHIGHAQTRKRQVLRCRQFTGQRLDLNDQLWGEKPEVDPGGLVLPSPPIAPCKSACATDSRLRGAYSDARKSRRCSFPAPPSESSWPAGPRSTVAYIWPRDDSTRALPAQSALFDRWFMGWRCERMSLGVRKASLRACFRRTRSVSVRNAGSNRRCRRYSACGVVRGGVMRRSTAPCSS